MTIKKFINKKLAISLLTVNIVGQIILIRYPNIDIGTYVTVSLLAGIIILILYEKAELYFHTGNELVDKMMRCKLRKENGLNYCADCEDGFECAKGSKQE